MRRVGDGELNLGGTAALTAAKVYFLLAGYALVFTLTRLLGPAEYGRWVVVNGIVSFVSTLVIATTLKSVSRHVASEPGRVRAVRRAALQVQSVVAAVVAGTFVAAAPSIARGFGDPSLVTAVYAAALIPSLYAVYAVHIGVLNGQHRLGRQAAFDAGFATLKLVLVAWAAAAGWGAAGALGGFSAAVLVIVPIAHLATRSDGDATPFPWRRLVAFSAAALAFETCASAAHQASTLLVQRSLGAEAAGHYGAGVQVARVAHQISVAVTLGAFPAIAAASAGRATSDAVDHAFRYSILLAGTLAAAIWGNAAELTPVLVGTALDGAGPVARIAAPAFLCFALWFLGATALVATGRPRVAASVAACVLVIETTLVWNVLSAGAVADPGEPHARLVQVAWASLAAHGTGVVLVVALVVWGMGWRPSWRVARAALVTVATGCAAYAWRTHGWMVLVECAAEAAFAVGAAFALRVFTPGERRRILRRPA